MLQIDLEKASNKRMADLLYRVYTIHVELGGENDPGIIMAREAQSKENDPVSKDEFEVTKARCAQTILSCKKLIAERDKESGQTAMQLTVQISKYMKDCKDLYQKLRSIYEKSKKWWFF